MQVAILGASGFVGKHLAAALRARGDETVEASLRDPVASAETARDCDGIVNLAGESLGQRWNANVKRRIEESRVQLPKRFLDALAQRPRRTTFYVSASAIGYYGTSEIETFVEESPPGDDFLARVCIGWEREANRAADLDMRVGIVRSGFVLGNDGGALPRMLAPFRAGLGGVVGSGRQWISWIHIDDLVRIYIATIDGAGGVLNGCAPNPVTNEAFTHAVGEALHRPTKVPVPTFALRAMLGEGADIVLRGQRVLPRRATELGFRFEFSDVTAALTNLL